MRLLNILLTAVFWVFFFQILEAGPLFCLAYVGAFLICLGMVCIHYQSPLILTALLHLA